MERHFLSEDRQLKLHNSFLLNRFECIRLAFLCLFLSPSLNVRLHLRAPVLIACNRLAPCAPKRNLSSVRMTGEPDRRSATHTTPVHVFFTNSAFFKSSRSSLGPPVLIFALALEILTFKMAVLFISVSLGGTLLFSQRSGRRLFVILCMA